MCKPLSFLSKLYILLLIFELLPFFRPVRDAFSRAASIQNGFFVMLIGLLLLLLMRRGVLEFRNPVLRRAILFCGLLIGLSFVTSVLLFPLLGTLHGENSLTGGLSVQIYYLLIAVVFYFNLQVFRALSPELIGRLLDGISVFCILLGLIQIAILFGGSFLAPIYDGLDVFDLLKDSGYIAHSGRIPLTGSEPSAISQIVCILLLPYVMARYLHVKKKRRYRLLMIGLTVCSFFSFSSSVYVGLVADYLGFLLLRGNKRRLVYALVYLLVAVLLLLLLEPFGFFQNTFVGKQIHYLLFEKTTNVDNMSTGYRYTTVVNDFYCFLHYPISGIGNGNQGFLYNQAMKSSLVSETMRSNYQTRWALTGRLGLVSGGAFLPAFLSGYGLLGCLLLIRFIRYLMRVMRARRRRLNYLYEYFCIGGLAFLAAATANASIEGNFLALFVLSIPLCAGESRKEYRHASHRHHRDHPHNGSLRRSEVHARQLRAGFRAARSDRHHRSKSH